MSNPTLDEEFEAWAIRADYAFRNEQGFWFHRNGGDGLREAFRGGVECQRVKMVYEDRNAAEVMLREAGQVVTRNGIEMEQLQRLGARLVELLDEDHWAECEAMLLAAGVTPNA